MCFSFNWLTTHCIDLNELASTRIYEANIPEFHIGSVGRRNHRGYVSVGLGALRVVRVDLHI